MHGLYPIVRRVRRPLLVRDTPPVNAGSAEPVEIKMVNEVSSESPETTGGSPVPPNSKSDAAVTSQLDE